MIIILFIKLLITKGHINNKINSEISTNNSKRLQKRPDIVYIKISHCRNELQVVKQWKQTNFGSQNLQKTPERNRKKIGKKSVAWKTQCPGSTRCKICQKTGKFWT